MSWVTIIWSMVASACLTLAVIYFVVWRRNRTEWAHLLFSVTAASTTAIAFCELWLMRAETPADVLAALTWVHVPLFFWLVSTTWFVRIYLGAGRLWLAWTICGLRAFSLVANVVMGQNLNFRNVTSLRQVQFLGESVTVLGGIPNPVTPVTQFATLLVLIFVADAGFTAWRRGDRRKALMVGGSVEFFLLAGLGSAVAVIWGDLQVPVAFSLFYLGLVAVMGYELSRDTLRASQLVHQLQTSEARNSAILRAIPDLMFLQNKDGTYVDYHAPDASQLLMRPDQFLGRNMREVLPPAALRTLGPSFQRAVEGQEPVPVEYELQMPDRARHYEARMVPSTDGQVLSIVRDITERKQAEAALRNSLERHALATAAGGVGVWDWNLETGDIYVDPALKAILGFEDHEIRNHLDDWGRRVHPDDGPGVMARAQDHIDGKTPVYEVEHRMLHKDGSIRWFLARGSVVRREDGTAARVVGTDMDISVQKTSDKALEEAHTELARVSRLTALGEFAASISHEVSQPLTAIVMNAKTCLLWLASDYPDLAEIRAALLDVAASGKRADEIIRRNRELFQHRAVEKVPVDINTVIRDVAVLTRSHLQHTQVALETDLASGLPSILGDRLELQQVLLNLIRNATDAMASVDPSSRRLRIESRLTDNTAVQVTVSDAGIGLSGVDLTRMFTPSYTTKADGTGVGLSICRSIIEAHRGRLWAVQNDECGATFSFTVPVPGPQAVSS